jgi:N-acetylmuramoyl-L-alanine amidase-like protein
MARYPAAIWRGPVPNQGGPMGAVDLGVVHIMQGTLAGTDSWFHDPAAQVSAHFGIGKDGTVYQWVDTGTVAWAEAAFNDQAISVEHEGVSGDELTGPQLEQLVTLMRWVSEVHGVPLKLWPFSGWTGHGELGVAGGNHPDCPGTPIMLQLPEVLDLAAGNPQPQQEVRPKMQCTDPVTGGVWMTDENGALFAELGAPYVSGLNVHPEWKAGLAEGGPPCVGIAYWGHAGLASDGIVFFCEAASGSTVPYALYRFLRDGTPA